LIKFIRFWFPVIIYSGIIFCVSSLESVDILHVIPHFDKVLHLGEYALFGWLVARAIKGYKIHITSQVLLFWVALCTIGYGLSDEIHQYFVFGRQADIVDLIADTLGGICGGYIYIIMNKNYFINQK